jgi:peptidoglycan hydrolase-like protein with peptidoglycan-binding domain
VQAVLKLAGFWTGPIDGHWTAELTQALKNYQTHLGVPATGQVDTATLAALENTIAQAKTPATVPPSTSAPVTAAPMTTIPSTPTT